jgi:predicted secreted protein
MPMLKSTRHEMRRACIVLHRDRCIILTTIWAALFFLTFFFFSPHGHLVTSKVILDEAPDVVALQEVKCAHLSRGIFC